MKVSELFQDQTVRIDGADVDVAGLAYDSRKVVPRGLFAALVGAKADGHAFIPQALAAGASSVLCERELDTRGVTRIVAGDSRTALALCAKRFYASPSDRLTMIGVTGTNGKTTTTHLIQAVLEAAGQGAGIIGTLGSKLGERTFETGLTTPESVDLQALLADMIDNGAHAVSMEVSSHALVQGRVAGVEYDVGVFTNLTHDHLDFHGTMDAYFEAKARLFHERLKPGGRAVLNFDDARVRTLARPGAWSFSVAGEAAARVRVTSLSLALAGITMQVAWDGHTATLSSPLVGRFNAENLLAAFSTGLALELPVPTILAGLAAMHAVPGRLERVNAPGQPLVAVDYAHSPDALEKALVTLREVTSGRLVCVFGCGGDRDPVKRRPMGEVVARCADYGIVTNDNPRSEDPALIAAAIESGLVAQGSVRSVALVEHGYDVELDRAAAIARAIGLARAADAVLIAGKGHETYQQVGSEKRPFDDRQQARAALQGWRA